jgi:transcriptional regulator with XRE-family HTH domain
MPDTATLGTNVKRLRQRRRLSLRDAATRTGVSKSMLSKIERDLVSPTATILGRIAEGFGMSISQLVGGQPERGDVIVVRAADQPVFSVPTSGFERRSLSPASSNGSGVDFVANVLPPRQSSGVFPPHRPGVEETLVVAAGRLQLRLGEQAYQLDTGDSVFYRAHIPHQFDNPSDTETAVFFIVVNNAGEA